MSRGIPLCFLLLAAVLCGSVAGQLDRVTESGFVELPQGKTVELSGVPVWLADYDFPRPEFTFVRVRYGSTVRRASMWATDFPDADLNLAAQLAGMTKLNVTQPVRVLRLTDPALREYPFIYMAEVGSIELTAEEVAALRQYLDQGGFLLIDDFWGAAEWQQLDRVMHRVFPQSEARDLPLSHPLFHNVFDFDEKPQVVSIATYISGRRTERPDAGEVHYRAIVNEDERVMVLMCHNTDLADGWERIGVDERYTEEMCCKRALPMGINILVCALSKE